MSQPIFLISHQSDLSGAPISLFLLAKGLQRTTSRDIRFILPSPGPLLEKLNEAGISVECLSWPRLFSLYRLIRKEHPCLLHVNTAVNGWVARLGKWLRLPVVWHIREDLSAYPRLVRTIGNLADHIIVISESVKAYFPKEFWPKISVVYNAVDDDARGAVTALVQEGTRVFRRDIGFVGSIEPRKGVKELLAAFRWVHEQIPESRLHLVGKPLAVSGTYFQACKTFVRENSLESCVIWEGTTSNLPAFLERMELMVVPSLSEPFGRVVIESMAAGRLVVASRCGGIPEIIEDGVTGLLADPGDSTMLAEKILEALRLPPVQRSHIQTAAIAQVSTKYSLEKHAHDIEALYDAVLKGRGPYGT
jgi:glycosyltransferase involved in cell wall biosynthesis